MVTVLQQACGVPVTGHWISCPGKQDWSVGARRTGCGRGCGHVGEAGSLRGGCQWILKSGVAAWGTLEQEAGQVEGQPARACEHLASPAVCGPRTLLLLAWLSVDWLHTGSRRRTPPLHLSAPLAARMCYWDTGITWKDFLSSLL